jgi:hypothetical protein
MEKLRKLFERLWYSKERIVLAVMVLLLCWNVYRVVYPAKMPEPPAHRPPSRDTGDETLPTVLGFEPRQTEDWAAVYTPNPLWYYSGLRSQTNDRNKQAGREAGIKLLAIQKVRDTYRAQLQTETSRRWYDEGAAFESFVLLKIDPEAGTCEVRSEGQGRVLTLKMAE